VTKNGRSKVFDNEDFGFRQITVERPPRLAFEVTQERIDAFKVEAAFQKLATSRTDTPCSPGNSSPQLSRQDWAT
jgi:hypothetical protein